MVRLRRESRDSWGGRKLARVHERQGGPALAPSTVSGILRHAGLLDSAAAPGQRPFQRFEREAPNDEVLRHFNFTTLAHC